MINSLEIDSKDFGKIIVNNNQKVVFPKGLYGFESFKEFYIINYDEMFKCLQSKEDKNTAFIIINPLYFKNDYILDIDEEDYTEIGLKPDEEECKKYLDLYVIVTIPHTNPDDMTANLLGPIIINSKNHKGKQALSRNPLYTVRHNILEELKSSNGGK